MNPITAHVLLVVIVTVSLFVIIYYCCILFKRPLRKGELRHLVSLIRDPNGNSDATALCKRCIHLSEHYHIPLSEVGFDDERDLHREAFSSNSRAHQRECSTLAAASKTT